MGEYLRGLTDGLQRAKELVEYEFYISPEKALGNIRCFLSLEADDAASHADVGECIASLLNSHCPRCVLDPAPMSEGVLAAMAIELKDSADA